MSLISCRYIVICHETRRQGIFKLHRCHHIVTCVHVCNGNRNVLVERLYSGNVALADVDDRHLKVGPAISSRIHEQDILGVL
jgi:hypothetical protein